MKKIEVHRAAAAEAQILFAIKQSETGVKVEEV